jgi:hypothetical protein
MDLAAVYSREIDGRTLNIAPTGWTYDNTFVLWDRETGTLWYPYDEGLRGIQGEYFDRWLPKRESDDTKWRNWRWDHPESGLLK